MPFQAQPGMFPILSFLQANPALAGVQESFKTNDYLADAMYKQQQARYAGLQPLSLLASSPNLWALMSSDQQQMLANSIANALPQSGGASRGGLFSGGGGSSSTGGSQPPQPNGGAPINAGGGNGSGQSTGAPNNFALIPGSGKQGVSGSAKSQALAKYGVQPVEPGRGFINFDTGQVGSAGDNHSISVNQNVMTGVQNAYDQLNDIGNEAKEFLGHGSTTKINAASISGGLDKIGLPGSDTINKHFGIDENYGSRYAKYNADKKTVIESLKSALNLPNSDQTVNILDSIITPIQAEGPLSYKKRVLLQLDELSRRYNNAQQNLGAGYNLSQPEVMSRALTQASASLAAPNQGTAANQPGFNSQVGQQLGAQPDISEGSKRLAQGLQLPRFNNKKEFQDWYSKQDKTTKNAVRLNLGKAS